MTEYLDVQRVSSPPEAAKLYEDLGRLYQQKLYHQLGSKLLEVSKTPFFQSNQKLVDLHQNFVSKIETKVKTDHLAQFAIAASRQLSDAEVIPFLQKLAGTFTPAEDADALLLVNMAIAQVTIRLGKVDEVKSVIEENKAILDGRFADAPPHVHSAVYQTCMEYHKLKGTPVQFFQYSLLYLAYTPLDTIPVADQIKLACDVGISALVGDKIYNFGELLQHPILNVLNGTEHAWLAELLFAFNRGDIRNYQAIAEAKASSTAVLVNNAKTLNQKIRIMALIEMLFKRPSENRSVPFKDIADTCLIPLEEVELLLIKAFSLKVIKGIIDQVEQTVRIKWVQPRVLDKNQIGNMRDRMSDWAKEVHQIALYVEQNAPDLIHKV